MSARELLLPLGAALSLTCVVMTEAWSQEPAPVDPAGTTETASDDAAPADREVPGDLDFSLDPGKRPFRHRLSFMPGVGRLGNQKLFALRLAYNPNPWLGYEAQFEHNPGESVHALLYMLGVMVRPPVAFRIQPYGTLGYGMMLVFPGETINADPVTENALAFGGGLEFYLRNDLALRAEARHITLLGGSRGDDGVVAYNYGELLVGMTFYRTLGR